MPAPDQHVTLEGELHHLGTVLGHFLEQQKNDLDWRKSQSQVATKHDLENLLKLGHLIMNEIQTYAAKQNAFNERMGKAIDGLAADYQKQTALIEKLQTTPGPISKEDQATLDQLEASAETFTKKLEALDDLTPPTPPTGGGTGDTGGGTGETGDGTTGVGVGGSGPGTTEPAVGSTDPTTGLPVTAESAAARSRAARGRQV